MELESIYPLVRKPSRYLGEEFNVVKKSWDQVALRTVLIFPDLYEIGMSHHGLQILYHIINGQAQFLAERAYAPDLDLEDLLRKEGRPIFSLESKRPLVEFDLIGMTLPYELCYTNILTILDLAGLPFKAKDRDESMPLLIGGGSCSCNPEPVADFFDAIVLGDGEEAILDILQEVEAAKAVGENRSLVLRRLAAIDGVYVPAFFEPAYDEAGRLVEIRPLLAGYDRVKRRILADLADSPLPYPPLVPLNKIVHDRLGVEIARGCTRGCRFCQAGVIYRPVRERSPDFIQKAAIAGLEAGGFDELALLSLSTGDYACLSDVLIKLMDAVADHHVSVSMPSMRVGTLTREIMDQIKRVRKTGFTVAPEAGSDRLRRVINKGITEADLLETCRSAFGLGWKLIKFYFMFGLPTETMADIEAIPELARRALKCAGGGGKNITVSIATFVPKPHTPFQWEEQMPMAAAFERVDYLKKNLPRRGFKLKWNDPRQSLLEGVFSRGDRRLADLLEAAWQRGARFDGWAEHFDLERWQQAAQAVGLTLESFLRRREFTEVLPWQHLESGVTQKYLRQELEKAMTEAYTPDCRVHGCQKCGVCDLKTIKPIVWLPEESKMQPAPLVGQPMSGDQVSERARPRSTPLGSGALFPKSSKKHVLYRISYARRGAAVFLGHLELIKVFFMAFRRAHLPLNFSEGFNPSPLVSFSPALPVGTESEVEYLDGDLSKPLDDLDDWLLGLNRQLPAGLTITSITPLKTGKEKKNKALVTRYQVALPKGLNRVKLVKDLADFLASQEFLITRVRKGRRKQLDIRPLVKEMAFQENGLLELVLLNEPGRAGVNPQAVMREVLLISEQEILTAKVKKTGWQSL